MRYQSIVSSIKTYLIKSHLRGLFPSENSQTILVYFLHCDKQRNLVGLKNKYLPSLISLRVKWKVLLNSVCRLGPSVLGSLIHLISQLGTFILRWLPSYVQQLAGADWYQLVYVEVTTLLIIQQASTTGLFKFSCRVLRVSGNTKDLWIILLKQAHK